MCARDHWGELTKDERAWCVRRVCDEIAQTADDWSETPQMLGLMNGAVPAASVISEIVMRTDVAGRASALAALAAALTHPNREVRMAAARGSRELWSEYCDLALRCVHALRVEAMTFQQSFDAEQAKPYRKRTDAGKLRGRAASVARKIIRGKRTVTADDVSTFTLDGWFTADASIAILAMLSNAPEEQTTVDSFAQVATTLVAWWEADRHHRSQREHSFETEYALKDLLAEGLFDVPESDAAKIVQPLLDAVDTHADKVADVLHDIIIREDRNRSTPRFWLLWRLLWRLFADRVRTARWLPNIDSVYAWGRQLLDWVLSREVGRTARDTGPALKTTRTTLTCCSSNSRFPVPSFADTSPSCTTSESSHCPKRSSGCTRRCTMRTRRNFFPKATARSSLSRFCCDTCMRSRSSSSAATICAPRCCTYSTRSSKPVHRRGFECATTS